MRDVSHKLCFAIVVIAVIALAGCSASLEDADTAFLNGDFEKAARYYTQVLSSENKLKASQKAEIYMKMGKSYDNIGKLEFAVEAYQSSIDLKPDDAMAYIALAHDLEKLGRYEEEVHALKSSLILDGENPHTETMLGNAYARLGQYVNALNAFKAAAEHNPRDPEIKVNMGLVYDKIGFANKALFLWEEALSLDPGNELALQNMGSLYMRTNRLPEAVRIYRKLVELYPDSLKMHSKLGVALYNSGMYGEALGEFSYILERDKNFPGAKDNARLAERWLKKTVKAQGEPQSQPSPASGTTTPD